MYERAFCIIGLLSLGLAGCSRVPVYPISGQELASLKDQLLIKDQQIRGLEESIQEKDARISQMQKDIEELKAKLRTFGVF